MKILPQTGLSNNEVHDIKVFMKSYNDAINCSKEIAQKDTSTDHYKNYIKLIISSVKQNNILIDSDFKIFGSQSPETSTYAIMKFAQQKHS